MGEATEWFNKAAWLGAVNLKPHGSINVDQFYRQYHARPDLWKAAFQFLGQDLTKIEPGKYRLAGDDVYASVNDYQTKLPEDANWEAHRKYIDLQYIISGEEMMGILPLEKTVMPEEYNESKDLIFFGEAVGEQYLATPDTFFLFFPSDAHRPSMQTDSPEPVRKLVIKIAFAG